MHDLNWISGTEFEIGGYTIRMHYEHGGSKLKSEGKQFLLMKAKNFLPHYTSLSPSEYRRVLELGVYQGGSFVFLDQLLKPERISALELSTTPIPALDAYVSENADRAKLYYGTSQDDVDKLHHIVQTDFGGQLDLVVDDASHFYEQTKTSFQTLFPRLRPNGLYIIEDWGWSFQDAFQAPDNGWAPIPSPANLMTDLLEDMTRNGMIANIEVERELWKIRRSSVAIGEVFTSTGRRGKQIDLF